MRTTDLTEFIGFGVVAIAVDRLEDFPPGYEQFIVTGCRHGAQTPVLATDLVRRPAPGFDFSVSNGLVVNRSEHFFDDLVSAFFFVEIADVVSRQ